MRPLTVRIKLCNVVDEFTREALAIRVGRSCTAEDVVEVIAGLIAERDAPTYLRSDNGPSLSRGRCGTTAG
jgi:putative transposase